MNTRAQEWLLGAAAASIKKAWQSAVTSSEFLMHIKLHRTATCLMMCPASQLFRSCCFYKIECDHGITERLCYFTRISFVIQGLVIWTHLTGTLSFSLSSVHADSTRSLDVDMYPGSKMKIKYYNQCSAISKTAVTIWKRTWCNMMHLNVMVRSQMSMK